MPPKKPDACLPSAPAETGQLDIVLVFDLMEEVQRQAIAASAKELLNDEALLKEVWPGAYDARPRKGLPLDLGEVELVVLHLDRIGAPAGASGAQVFAAYFVHRPPSTAECAFLASPPLIMKLGKPAKLRKEEYSFLEKWPTLTSHVRARLALPIHLSEIDEVGVLWSPFRSDYVADPTGQGQQVGLDDLWKLLHSPDELTEPALLAKNSAGALIGDALHIMATVHRANRPKYLTQEAVYSETYSWYLRETTDPDHWRHKLITNLFGDAASTRRFDRDWPNPRNVIAKIVGESLSFQGVFGPVHGDLHPKNIVSGLGSSAHIIDFGWAHEHRHVVADYLLLDLNLRAVTLPSHVPEGDVLRLAGYLDFDEDPTALPTSVAARAGVIRERIWRRALHVEKVVQDWRTEYLIPYFIVAYGLLVYLDAARNQDALMAAVLSAAEAAEAGWNDG